MIVCDDDDKNEIIDIIMDTAQTGESGNSGDGRIFVLPVEESYTISSQSKDDQCKNYTDVLIKEAGMKTIYYDGDIITMTGAKDSCEALVTEDKKFCIPVH